MEKVEEYVTLISEKTGFEKKLVKTGLIGAFLLVFVLGFGASIVANLVGVLFPAFQSFKALENGELSDDNKWLTYWIVFSTFSILDHFAGIILTWVPFYFLFKLGFLIYLFMPMTDGAQVIYRSYILPLYKKYEKDLDALEEKYTSATSTHSKKD